MDPLEQRRQALRTTAAAMIIDRTPIDQPSLLRPALEIAGGEVEVTTELFAYFLDVLPPVRMPFYWRDQCYAFGFAEGVDSIIGFRRDRTTGRHFAVLTDVISRS
jgi:hypothetical protein